MTELVQAWNGKWHIFERDLKKVPAQPVDRYNLVAKPERQVAVTGCGLQVFAKNSMTVRSYRDLYEHLTRVDSSGVRKAVRRPGRSYCKYCFNVLKLRHPIGIDPGPTDEEVEATRNSLLEMINDT